MPLSLRQRKYKKPIEGDEKITLRNRKRKKKKGYA